VQPGTISGTLYTIEGLPAAGVRVTALEAGNSIVTDSSQAMASIAQTDSRGRYKLEDVPPGRYFITAGMLDLQTYFPGAPASSGANIVTVGPSSKLAGLDFSLFVASGLRFSGKVIRLDNAGKTLTGPVTAPVQPLQIRLQGMNLPAVTAVVTADNKFDFPQVRPGTYNINIQPFTGGRQPNMTVTLLDRDITDYELTVPLMVQVSGTVTVEEEGVPLPRFPIVFSNAGDSSVPFNPLFGNPNGVQQNVQTQANPRFTVQVPAGANRVTLGTLPAGFKIKKFVADGVDLLANPLNVTTAGAAPIQIVLSATDVPWVRVSGRVNGRGIYTGNAITISPMQATAIPLQVVLYLDGSFEIPKALPGTYRVTGVPGNPGELFVPDGVTEVRDVMIDLSAPDNVKTVTPVARPSSAVRISGRVVGRAKAQPGVQVRLENAETGEFRSAPLRMDGTFEFDQAQPGEYVAEMVPRMPGAEPQRFAVGVRDIGSVQLRVPAMRDLNGKMTLEGVGELPRTVAFVASSARVSAEVRPDGSFTIALPEGPVALAADAVPEGYTVGTFQYGKLDLLSNPLQLSGQDSDLRVSLKSARGAALVEGRVTGELAGLNDMRVWLSDVNGRQRTIETSFAPNSGAFAFADVGDGKYTVSLVGSGLPGNIVSAEVSVTAGRNITDLNLPAPRLVRGKITVASGAAPQRFSLRLDGGPSGATMIVIDPQRDGSFGVFLPTGERKIGPAAGLPAGREIQAIKFGAVDALSNAVQIPVAGALDELTIQLK
jgi:hypothetical protein